MANVNNILGELDKNCLPLPYQIRICYMKLKLFILLISLLSGSLEAQTIHYNAFSHNDYERPRPLFDALSFQFNCVEADLWLIDGELYVSHDSVAPNPDITFEKLYLLPLEIGRAHV